jgi:hypothetical protein
MSSERIDPLFFGASECRLFGCHHGPAQGSARCGVLIAAPLGHEYVRAHRALAQLASLCAAGGLRALRFDWSSTGDSSGDAWPDSLEAWSADVESAQRELLLRTRVSRSAWVGARLAGALMLQACASRAPLSSLVLWDPVLDLQDYVRGLSAAQQRFIASIAAASSVEQPGIECLGYLWPSALLDSLRRWRAPSFTTAPAARVLILESEFSVPAQALARELTASGARVVHERSTGPTPWHEELDRGLIPLADLRRIVEFLSEEA